ncbi:glycoside hydrolase family 2 protein [Rubellicoccus peritrichatus]|uniref:Glycoside hydrolase family 2 TIM barrel-domain containing protein n=1 Tax=Rubellicoccus peritrichatus TaxID=3080537 RepID=A0AAQ3L6P1_9BACT|nr:sugar-binding domain-containing protein [Puniceicoccus sp. CR14]WOO40061.1 glycoside hydrolase family 2 TIM barrel-domain containing protein [Puniceicoccus sp. CR14]
MSQEAHSNKPTLGDSKGDFFADIAAQEIVYREGSLVEPQPIACPDVRLPFVLGDSSGVFTPVERSNSPEALAHDLDRIREEYAVFMQRHDPSVDSSRERLSLRKFDWRLETQEDRVDFQAVCSGAGDWENVDIPHYGGPLGKATSIYRTELSLTEEQLSRGVAMLHFDGVDYKAHVFVNGYFVGSHEGFFAPFEFDVSRVLKAGINNVVVRVENDAVFNGNRAWGQNYSGDKVYAATGPGYDDPIFGWHHCPPGMGIYQGVFLEFRPRVYLGDIFVRPRLEHDSVEVWLEIINQGLDDASVSIRTSIYGRNFETTVVEDHQYAPEVIHDCGLGDTFQIAKAKAEGKYLKSVPLNMERGVNFLRFSVPMKDYRLWSPESPWLYQCKVTLCDSDGLSIDCMEQHFGMRSFQMDENTEPKGRLYLNGEPIRLRGANTMGHEQQCVMKEDWDQLRDDILLAKLCNMNFLRLTQRPVQKEIYDFCDMLGLMTQTDLPLFGVIRRNQYCEILRQVEEMEKLVRAHPCNIMVSYINEPTRNADNRPHRHIQRDEMERFFSAADDIVRGLNPDRVIKACDGDYDPPSPGIQDRHCYPCWYNGHGMDIGKLHRGFWQPTKPGWLYACGEYGAEGLDFSDLMYGQYPAEWLQGVEDPEADWSPSDILWAQTGNYHYFFFDTQDILEDWVEASQEHQAWATKLMTEAFRRDPRMVSFAIHLFIDAFPAGWMKAIMDCRRCPKPAYFAYRDALAPILPSIRTDRKHFVSGEAIELDAWVCNDLNQFDSSLSLSYFMQCDGEVVGSGKVDASLRACYSVCQGVVTLPAPVVPERTKYTFRLALVDGQGETVNDCSQELEIFPAFDDISPIALAVLNGGSGRACRLAVELGFPENRLCSISEAQVILIDEYEEYVAHREEVDRLVSSGARAVFLSFEPGQYDIGGDSLVVKLSDFNPLYFVSRRTGSIYVEGLQSHDFCHWYHPGLDRIAPLLEATFTSSAFEPVLTSGNTENGQWGPALAVGEKCSGLGSYILCQIDLAGRVDTNPTARIFCNRIMGMDASVLVSSRACSGGAAS